MPDVDRDLFNKRIKKLYSYWQVKSLLNFLVKLLLKSIKNIQTNKNSTENVDAICVVTGADSESAYYKTTAVQVFI